MTGAGAVRVITGREIGQLLPMAEAVEVMEEAFVALAEGRAHAPLRITHPLPAPGATGLAMAGAFGPWAGVKSISVHPGNPERGLPRSHAIVLLMDGRDGRPVAILDAEVLTALRTGAGAGLATRLLARPESRVVAIFGAGVQARALLEAVCAVRPVELAWIFARRRRKAEAFARAARSALGVEAHAADRPGRLTEADVVCTATPATEPLFRDEELPPGAHINAVGSFRRGMCEVPPETVARARVVLDDRAACLAEAGDLLYAAEAGLFDPARDGVELGEIACGRARGRTGDAQVTLFKSVGIAVQDIAAAARVFEKAEAAGVGRLVEL